MRYKALLLYIFWFFHHCFALCQSNYASAEDLLLNHQADSAKLSILGNSQEYAATLIRIADKLHNNDDLIRFSTSIEHRPNPDYGKLAQFIDDYILVPTEKQLHMDYVMLRWIQITWIRNELLDVERSSKLNQELKSYINQTRSDERTRTLADLYTTLHDIVLLTIEMNDKEGIPLCRAARANAESIGDTSLIIATYNLENDLLVLQGKLDDYIANARLSLNLDRTLRERSRYYENTITQLINALIYKGGFQAEVYDLLLEFYSNDAIKPGSYWLFLQFLLSNQDHKIYQEKVFELFKVQDPVSLCSRLRLEAEGNVNDLRYIDLLREAGKYLSDLGYQNESKKYFMEALYQNRQVYSLKLSRTLADYERQLAKQENDMELSVEKEKTQFYIIIVALVSVFFIISVGLLIRMTNISRKLKSSNKEISRQRDQIIQKENELETLLNELNHRVKNNFQMIINMMELQSIELNDIKAQKMAREIQNRIKSMAIIHHQLLQNIGPQIEFNQYISQLISEIVRTYSLEHEPKVILDIIPCSFTLDTSIPLGLITNELITNAFKYGLSHENGELHISLKQLPDGFYELVVADNGNGLPADFQMESAYSMGLKLVKRLCQQLHGHVSYEHSDLTRFIIHFLPIP